jgi:signal transduction histidine kinase
MLANLIDNACKWASQTVLVTARVQSNPTCVAIAIEDDGLGLPEESMEVVFGIGERLDERVPGSGLGLPIVRDLAHLYGGSIRLERSSMGGLKAVLTLPWTS